ncbi:hypothetical protein, partial [Enterococcus faecium]
LSQNVVHSDSDLILHNSSVLIDKEPFSNGAISESTSEMEKASRMSEINFGVSLVFWGKQEIS